MSKKLNILASFALLLALALSLMGAAMPASPARHAGPELMPPHPDFVKKLEAQGYSLVTIYNMMNKPGSVDQPHVIKTAVTGTRSALVLLVDFSNNVHNAVSTSTLYNNMLFTDGTYTAPGSMRDFYQQNSYGLFDVTGQVSNWFRANNIYSYYAYGNGWGNPYPQNVPGLVHEIALAADASVDFSLYAQGGVVDSLFVVHAGAGAETGAAGAIWSHSWSITDGGGTALTLDGVTVDGYTIEPEYVYSAGDSTMGVFAHEYGHALGLPDLYDTTYATGTSIDAWSLMAGGSWNGNNGDSPATMDAWCKTQLGWITPTKPTADLLNQTIPPSYNNATAYKLWTNGVVAKQYFLVENRQQVGFDAALPGAGMLIYHVDEAKTGNTQRCTAQNNWTCGATHALVTIEQADGLYELDQDLAADAGDPFPGTTSNTSFTSATNPNTSSYASSTPTYVKVTGITLSGSDIIASLYVKSTAPGGPIPLSPSGATTDKTPTYKWTKLTGATQYRYQLYKGTTLIYTKTAPACATATCSNTPTTVLALGAYKWHVQAKVGGVWKAYSAYKTFSIATPKPKAGYWSGSVSFNVNALRNQVVNYAIYISVGGCGSYKITRTVAVPIVGGRTFAFTGPFYANGTFSNMSAPLTYTSAAGKTGLSSFPIAGCGNVSGGPWNWTANWASSGSPLPSGLSVEAVSASPDYWIATLDK